MDAVGVSADVVGTFEDCCCGEEESLVMDEGHGDDGVLLLGLKFHDESTVKVPNLEQ